jgi:hypothetical protein
MKLFNQAEIHPHLFSTWLDPINTAGALIRATTALLRPRFVGVIFYLLNL